MTPLHKISFSLSKIRVRTCSMSSSRAPWTITSKEYLRILGHKEAIERISLAQRRELWVPILIDKFNFSWARASQSNNNPTAKQVAPSILELFKTMTVHKSRTKSNSRLTKVAMETSHRTKEVLTALILLRDLTAACTINLWDLPMPRLHLSKIKSKFMPQRRTLKRVCKGRYKELVHQVVSLESNPPLSQLL